MERMWDISKCLKKINHTKTCPTARPRLPDGQGQTGCLMSFVFRLFTYILFFLCALGACPRRLLSPPNKLAGRRGAVNIIYRTPIKGYRNAVLGDLLQSTRVYLAGGDWHHYRGRDSGCLDEGGPFRCSRPFESI